MTPKPSTSEPHPEHPVFTSEAFIGALRSNGITISMDGKGRCIDNVGVHFNSRASRDSPRAFARPYVRTPQARARYCGTLTNLSTSR